MSKGYDVASEPAKKFEFVEAAPAGSSSVSAMDMAHFMMAHLQDGNYEGAQILKPETAKLMIAPVCESARHECHVPRLLRRDPEWPSHHRPRRRYAILPQRPASDPRCHLGFFISYNSAGKR